MSEPSGTRCTAGARGKYRIFCKVRLADIVRPLGSGLEENGAFRKIGNYHVDFVLCEPKITAPLLVIELDDGSHQLVQQFERDIFKDAVLAAAGIPFYRVPVREAYAPSELAQQIERLIATARPGKR